MYDFLILAKRVWLKVAQNKFVQGRGKERMCHFSVRQGKSNKVIGFKYLFRKGSNRDFFLFSEWVRSLGVNF